MWKSTAIQLPSKNMAESGGMCFIPKMLPFSFVETAWLGKFSLMIYDRKKGRKVEEGHSFCFCFSCHTLGFLSEKRRSNTSFGSLNAYGKFKVGLEIQDSGNNWNWHLLSSILCSAVKLKFLMLKSLKLSDWWCAVLREHMPVLNREAGGNAFQTSAEEPQLVEFLLWSWIAIELQLSTKHCSLVKAGFR